MRVEMWGRVVDCFRRYVLGSGAREETNVLGDRQDSNHLQLHQKPHPPLSARTDRPSSRSSNRVISTVSMSESPRSPRPKVGPPGPGESPPVSNLRLPTDLNHQYHDSSRIPLAPELLKNITQACSVGAQSRESHLYKAGSNHTLQKNLLPSSRVMEQIATIAWTDQQSHGGN